MKKNAVNRILLMLGAMILAFSLSAAEVAPPEDAQGDSGKGILNISPLGPSAVTVGASQAARVRLGWIACSKGLVQDGINSIRGKYILKKGGTTVQTLYTTPSKWGKYQPRGGGEGCIWPVSRSWMSWYYSPNLKLTTPGTYKLRVKVWLKVPIIDGLDGNSKWPIDYVPAGNFIGWKTITITKK